MRMCWCFCFSKRIHSLESDPRPILRFVLLNLSLSNATLSSIALNSGLSLCCC
jgi:hypothetical protein